MTRPKEGQLVWLLAACALLVAVWLLLFRENNASNNLSASHVHAREKETEKNVDVPILQGSAVLDDPTPEPAHAHVVASDDQRSTTKWTVQVSDGRDGSPVKGARVSLTKRASGLIVIGEASVSDEAGRCKIEALSDVAFMNVHCEGYLPWQSPIANLSDTSIVSAKLDVGRVLTGEVVKLGGEPMVGARVKVHVSANRIGSVAKSARRVFFAGKRGAIAGAITDALGRFRLSGLPFDENLVAWASMPGWIPRLFAQQKRERDAV